MVTPVAQFRPLPAESAAERHNGEVYGCTYTPDGAFVLSGGWDGYLRLWDAATGVPRVSLQASPKPLSCCACSPDGTRWLSGSMEGLLSVWDGVSLQPLLTFVAHTRPISGICFSPDGERLATCSWDRHVTLRLVGKEREGRNLLGHRDIVTGCAFTPDGGRLLSWSHDGTVKVWDVSHLQEVATLNAHRDRVTWVSLAPDGRFAASGGRDGQLCWWDLERLSLVSAVNLGAELRTCFCLLDGEHLVAGDAAGRLFLLAVPSFEAVTQVQTPARAISGALAPTGTQVALGGEDGLVHRIAIDGLDDSPLVVVARPQLRDDPTLLDRFFGKSRVKRIFRLCCPGCRHALELVQLPADRIACPSCHRPLRVAGGTPALERVPANRTSML